jgi:hypothetical protein
VHAEVSNLDRPENKFERGRGKLLEVYRPVWTPAGQPLLFETYSPYQQVTQRAGQLWRGFAGITISGLLIMVALLLPILWRLLNRISGAQRQREVLLQRAVDASEEERRRIAGTLHDGRCRNSPPRHSPWPERPGRLPTGGSRNWLRCSPPQPAPSARASEGSGRCWLTPTRRA